MIKTVIIDDEPGCIETLSLLLQRYHPLIKLIGTATSIESGLSLIEKHKDEIDLLFLDIQMPGGDGFSLLKAIHPASFRVIFTTAYDQYAVKAIRASALDYLLKPIDNDELAAALERFSPAHEVSVAKQMDTFIRQFPNKNHFEKMAVSAHNGVIVLDLSRVIYLESDNNYTTLHLTDGQRLVSSKNLGHYEDLLQHSSFFRIHNSYLVNLKKVDRYVRGGSGMVEMEGGTRLQVSTRRREDFLKSLSLI